MIHNTNIVPFVDLNLQNMEIKKEVLHELGEMIDKSQFILGEQVEIFEKEFADYCESGHSVGVASGTDALTLAVRSLSLNPGDEVILPVNTFVATAEAVVHGGGTPVLVDIQSNSYNIEPDLIENSITPKTKAIIPVHIGGHMCEMEEISAIAKKFNIHIIEDAAQAICGSVNGKKAGYFSKISAFSMNPMKMLNAYGECGIITTSNKNLYQRVLRLRHAGTKKDIRKIHINRCYDISLNYKIDTIQASFLLENLKS